MWDYEYLTDVHVYDPASRVIIIVDGGQVPILPNKEVMAVAVSALDLASRSAVSLLLQWTEYDLVSAALFSPLFLYLKVVL